MQKLALLQQVIEMNTASTQDNNGPKGGRVASLGWWAGFIVPGIALNAIAAYVVPTVLGLLIVVAFHACHPYLRVRELSMPCFMGLLLALAALIPAMGAIGVLLGSKVSKHHRARAAKVLATVGAVVWMIATICWSVAFAPKTSVTLFEAVSAWVIPVAVGLNVVGQIVVARMIVKRATVTAPVNA
jgi:hypothetical protein